MASISNSVTISKNSVLDSHYSRENLFLQTIKYRESGIQNFSAAQKIFTGNLVDGSQEDGEEDDKKLTVQKNNLIVTRLNLNQEENEEQARKFSQNELKSNSSSKSPTPVYQQQKDLNGTIFFSPREMQPQLMKDQLMLEQELSSIDDSMEKEDTGRSYQEPSTLSDFVVNSAFISPRFNFDKQPNLDLKNQQSQKSSVVLQRSIKFKCNSGYEISFKEAQCSSTQNSQENQIGNS